MDYAKKAKDVSAKLKKFGAPITLGDIEVTTNPFTGQTVTNTANTFETVGLRLDWTEQDLKNTTIQVTDAKLMIGATAGIPKKGMTATFAGTTYNVAEIMPFSPAGTPIFYYLALRV
jgi:hypothetical protein